MNKTEIDEVIKAHLDEMADQSEVHELADDPELMIMSYSDNVWATIKELGGTQEQALQASIVFGRMAGG